MAESITYDFISRGADKLSGDFRKTGDSAALAARGAKVLQDVIKDLGQKEDRTAAQSRILAAALRQTGDAEDRAAAKAVAADAAIRRLDDAMKDSSKQSGELGKALGSLKLNPGLLGPAVALAPALATLGGVVTGVAAGLSGAFVAGSAALAAFGSVAKPVLTDAKTAATAVETAQNNYNAAIAGGTKKAVAYKAEQIAIAKAYAGLSPAQIALSRQLGAMSLGWDKVKAAETPVVAGALQPWLKSVTDLTGKLGPIIGAVSPFIAYLGTQFGRLVNSAAFNRFRDFIAGTGSVAVGAAGNAVIDLLKAFIVILPQFAPLINRASAGVLSFGQNILAWAQSKKASDDITKFMAWFSTNGPVVGRLLVSIGAALKALAPGLTTGGVTELNLITGFFGFVAKLPPSVAKPLAEVAGALLILNKLGVISAFGGIIGGAQKAVTAIGGMTKAMLGFDAAASANVIGLIVIAIAALAAGFAIAWKKSAAFRDVIKTIGSALLEAGIIVVQANKIIVDSFLSMVGTILHGAADAFGWVPGLGSKLRGASKAFDDFKAGVDGAFNHMIGTMRGWQGELGKSRQASDAATSAILKDFQGQSAAARRGRDDMVSYTNAVVFNGAKSDQARSARQRLIADLEHSGVQAGTARQLVNNLQASISGLHGKTVRVTVIGSGTGTIRINSYGVGQVGTTGLKFMAAGGRVPFTAGVPGRDSVLVMTKPGEIFVPPEKGPMLAPALKAAGIPGFAQGGIAGAPSWVAQEEAAFGGNVEQAFASRALAAAKKAAAPAGGGLSTSAGIRAEQLYALKLFPYFGWGSGQLPPLIALWNRESGWNPNARNPTSGAFGIPQALPPSKMGALGGTWAGQILWGEGYIKGRYGSPAAAWGHETAFGWYGNGLDAVVSKPTIIGVGERGRERVQVTPVTGSAGGGATVIHVTLQNHGAIGSPAELEAWLEKQFSALAYKGKARRILKSVGGM